jgi:hypothetical protein
MNPRTQNFRPPRPAGAWIALCNGQRGIRGAMTYLRCHRTPPECERTVASGAEKTPLGPAAATSPPDPRLRRRNGSRDSRPGAVLQAEPEVAMGFKAFPTLCTAVRRLGGDPRPKRLAAPRSKWPGDRHQIPLGRAALVRSAGLSTSPSSGPVHRSSRCAGSPRSIRAATSVSSTSACASIAVSSSSSSGPPAAARPP